MKLLNRDLAIVSGVAHFGQLRSSHIRRAFFYENKSDTPCDRALRRLKDLKLITTVGPPQYGGEKGGGGERTWQLGPAGWKLTDRAAERYIPKTSVDYHGLMVADVWVELAESPLDLTYMEVEHDAKRTIAGYNLAPDMYIEFLMDGRKGRAWIEVETGSHHRAGIKDKLRRYEGAYTRASDVFPLVLWVTPQKTHTEALRRWVSEELAEYQQLYRFAELGDVVGGMLHDSTARDKKRPRVDGVSQVLS